MGAVAIFFCYGQFDSANCRANVQSGSKTVQPVANRGQS